MITRLKDDPCGPGRTPRRRALSWLIISKRPRLSDPSESVKLWRGDNQGANGLRGGDSLVRDRVLVEPRLLRMVPDLPDDQVPPELVLVSHPLELHDAVDDLLHAALRAGV